MVCLNRLGGSHHRAACPARGVNRMIAEIKTVFRESYRTLHPGWVRGYAVYIDGDCAHWYRRRFMASAAAAMYIGADDDHRVDVFPEWRQYEGPTTSASGERHAR